MRHVCKRFETHDQCDVELIQNGFDRFTVIYGKQVESGLNYAEAATALGGALMHALSCAGHIDNRTKAEAKEAGDTTPHFDIGGEG